MNVIVAYKWAADPQAAVVGPDGSVDLGRARPTVSEYDAVAIQVGREVADAMGAELVGITVGGPDSGTPMATKAALARGLDRVVVLSDVALQRLGTTATAQLLGALVGIVGDTRLVLAGDCSTDVAGRMVPAVLGGVLGWPAVTEATSVCPDGADLVVARALDGGRQWLRVAQPAVVALASDAAKPTAPGMKDILSAGKKPVRLVALAQTGVIPTPDGTVVAMGRPAGPVRAGAVVDAVDPDAAAAELVDTLRAAGLVAVGSAGR